MPKTLPALVLATSNKGKFVELEALLKGLYRVVRRPAGLPETDEDGDTLEANAVKKALEVSEVTGQIALADDSGLFVDALAGDPGVQTARYAGPQCDPDDNIDKLLAALDGFEPTRRTATFRTVIAVVNPSKEALTAGGEVLGRIATERRGERGFGYDPVFEPLEAEGLTFAEMDLAHKQSLSHRARALKAMLSLLQADR